MNLQEQINRMQSMMGIIIESNLPLNIRRRLNLSREENLYHLKDYVMRNYQPNKKEDTISNAFYGNSHRLLNNIEQEDDVFYWEKENVDAVKDFLESQFKEQIESFYDSLFGGEDDTDRYCFIKHSDRHMRLETNTGFGDCVTGWHNFLKKYGYWFPDLDWNEEKVRIDAHPNKSVLIKEPLQGHIYHYYFSVLKK